MQLTLKAVFTDGTTQTIETNLATVVAWERKYRRKASEMASGIGVEDLAFMAYESCKQAGITVPAVFDDYVKKLAAIEVVGQEPENPS